VNPALMSSAGTNVYASKRRGSSLAQTGLASLNIGVRKRDTERIE